MLSGLLVAFANDFVAWSRLETLPWGPSFGFSSGFEATGGRAKLPQNAPEVSLYVRGGWD